MNPTLTPEDILPELENYHLRTVNMACFARNNPVIRIERHGSSFLLKGKSDQVWVYISCTDRREYGAILDKTGKQDRYFAIVEDDMLPLYSSRWQFEWKLSCLKLYLDVSAGTGGVIWENGRPAPPGQ